MKPDLCSDCINDVWARCIVVSKDLGLSDHIEYFFANGFGGVSCDSCDKSGCCMLMPGTTPCWMGALNLANCHLS